MEMIPTGGKMTDQDIIDGLKKLHEAMGHAPKQDMLRALRLGHARARAIKLCREFDCPECPRHARPQLHRTVQPRRTTHFGEEVGLDLLEVTIDEGDGRTTGVAGLNIVDSHTGVQVVWPIKKTLAAVTSEDVLTALELAWHWAPPTKRFTIDPGTEFEGIFAEACTSLGIPCSATGTEAHWQHGQVEVLGGIWKTGFHKLASQHCLTVGDFDGVVRGFMSMNRARNNRARHHGYSPTQWALGVSPTLPWSLTDNHENLAVQETMLLDGSPFKARLQLAADAEVAFLQADNDSRIRRALLHKARPQRGPYLPGAQVYFYRKRNALGKSNIERAWQGPAVVLCQRSESAVWVDHMGALVKVAPECLRFATTEELRSCQLIAAHLVLRGKELGKSGHARGYLDLTASPIPSPTPTESIPGPALGVPFTPQAESGGDEPVLSRTAPTGPPLPPGTPPTPHVAVQPESSRFAPFGLPVVRAPADDGQEVVMQLEDARGVHFGGEEVRMIPGRGGNDSPLVQPAGDAVGTGMKRPLSPDMAERAVRPRGETEELEDLDALSHQAEAGSQPAGYVVDGSLRTRLNPKLPRRNRRNRLLHEAFFAYGPNWDGASECYLTKGKKTKEVKYRQVSEEVRQQFRDAMNKEWSGWLDLDAVTVLSPSEVRRRRIPRERWIKTRFVLTDKNEPFRTPQRDMPVLPKARLVVWGHVDPELPFLKTDAPTISELATHLIYQAAASWGSPLVHGDIKQAFLSGVEVEKQTYLIPPVEGLPGVEPGSLLVPRKAIYGYADAPRCFWLKLSQEAEKAGWVQSKLEKALFYFYDSQGKLCGLGGPHVDDWVATGSGNEFEAALKRLRSKFQWGEWKIDDFTHCGRQVKRDRDGSVVVSQQPYLDKIKPMIPDAGSRGKPLSDRELGAGRSVLGNLGWAAKQTQPGASFSVSRPLGELTKRERGVVHKINKALERTVSMPTQLRFPSQLCLESASVVAFSDASWGNLEGDASQGGVMHGLLGKGALDGKPAPFSLLSWNSFRIRRVCRSTLSAEAQSACQAVEFGDYLKTLLVEMYDPTFRLIRYQERLQERQSVLVIDAKSLFDYLNKETGRLPADKRLGIDLRLLQTYLSDSKWAVRWVSGPQQLADCLTKETVDITYLKWVLDHGVYQLIKDTDLDVKVKTALEAAEERLVTQMLSPEEKAKVRSRRKSAKHRQRVEAIRRRMGEDLDAKPSACESNFVFATFTGMHSLLLASGFG